MEFGVLGPLEVSDGARAIALPPLQRSLLAALLCRPNAVVSADRLIDGLWGETPPRTAGKSLQVQLHHLRRALGDTRITHRAPGYTLTLDPDELDAGRFEALVGRGRSALTAGRTQEGVLALRQALALWRGPAFTGQDHVAMVAEEARRLTEQRLTVEEELIEAELQLGRHAEVLGRLTVLVSEHPFREGLRGQLMVALYRLGRQADALEVLREGRRLLADELGLEPGAPLRELERAILHNDPALDLSSPRPVSRVVPAELPVATAAFTGRTAAVERLRATLTGGSGQVAIAAIDGVGGSGKSALAVRVAHQVAAAFPDGQLYANLRGATVGLDPLPAGKVLGRWLRTLGAGGEVSPDDVDEAAARFRSLTSASRMLIVLDDAADAAQVRPLLPSGPGCAVLLTSRRMLSTLDGAEHLHLDTMSEPEALALLERLTTGGRVAAETEAAVRIVALCDRLPLALRIAGARLAAHPGLSLSAFADRLSDARHRLDELRHADLGVRTSFTASLDALSAEPDGDGVTRTFKLLGLLDGPNLALPTVTALTGTEREETRTALERLVEAQLLTFAAPDRYAMHDLVRLYAREQAHRSLSAEVRDAAWQRALHHYLANCRAASRVLDAATDHRMGLGPDTRPEDRGGIEFASRADAIDWIDAERDNLLAAVHQASSADGAGPAIAIGLAAALFRPFNMRGPYEDRLTVGRLALAAACRIGDVAAEAQSRNDLAWVCHVAGHLDEAVEHLERAVARWREAGDGRGLAHSLSNLGYLYAWQGRHDLSVANCEAGVAAFREMGDPQGEARALINLGGVYERARRYKDAVAVNERSLTLHRQLGHARGEAIACGNLAESHRLTGDPERAVPLFEQAIVAIHKVGDRAAEAEVHWFLGTALNTLGRREEARDSWRRSLALLTDMGAISAEEAAKTLRRPDPETPEPILRTK